MTCEPIVSGGPPPAPPAFASFARSGFLFLPRINAPAPVAPPLDAWDVLAPYFSRVLLPSSRIAGDTVDLISPGQWVTATDQSGVERQLVSEQMPPGISFGGARAWLVSRNGTATGTVRPWLSLRVCNGSGTAIVSTLLPLGQHGDGTNCNPNGTRLWAGNIAGGPPLLPYVSVGGERLVLELGYRMTGLGEANAVYGSFALTAGNEHAMHVMSTGAQGVNPGSRCPYLELSGVGWPA